MGVNECAFAVYVSLSVFVFVCLDTYACALLLNAVIVCLCHFVVSLTSLAERGRPGESQRPVVHRQLGGGDARACAIGTARTGA